MLPYHHRFNGPAAPHLHHTYRGLSPPVAQPHPQHRVKGPWPYKPKGPCPTKSAPAAAILILPTLPRHTVRPTFLAATEAPVTFIMTTASPVETPALWKQPVSTQSGLITTISPVETGRILPVRIAFQPNQFSSILSRSDVFLQLWSVVDLSSYLGVGQQHWCRCLKDAHILRR